MTTLACSLTALPGDFYVRVPLVDPRGVLSLIEESMAMADGPDPAAFPDLEAREPEEPDEGTFPIVVRTILAIEKQRLVPWLAGWCTPPASDGLTRSMSDADIAGVLYWGEEARWRLRRICVGRYSRYDELDDTSELDSPGAFRDWLLVQGNQTFAFTLFTNGWGEYNTTEGTLAVAFIQRWLNVYADLTQMLGAGPPVVPPVLDARKLGQALQELTDRGRGSARWEWALSPA